VSQSANGAVVTRTRNVSEYMLALALCLVFHCKHTKPCYDQLLKIRGAVWPWLQPLEAVHHAPTTTRRIQSVKLTSNLKCVPSTVAKTGLSSKMKTKRSRLSLRPPWLPWSTKHQMWILQLRLIKGQEKRPKKFTKWDGSMGNLWLRHTQGPWKWYHSTDHLWLSVSIL